MWKRMVCIFFVFRRDIFHVCTNDTEKQRETKTAHDICQQAPKNLSRTEIN